MSGSHFDYGCFRISQFAEELEHEIKINKVVGEYGDATNFSSKTISILKMVQTIILEAGNLAKEVEWLYSGDTGEENFSEAVVKILQSNFTKDCNYD